MVKIASRVGRLAPFLFVELNKVIREQQARGIDVITLGIGNPDQPPPPHVIDRLCEVAHTPTGHLYPESPGSPQLRRAFAEWYARRYGITLDPDREVEPLIGSKEAPAHLGLAIQDPGEVTLVPDPAFATYAAGAAIASCEPYTMGLLEENGFLPDLDAIPPEIAQRASIMWLNYPNNPTGAIATRAFFERVVEFAHRYDILIAHDAPYLETIFDGCEQPSLLAIPGAREVAVEIHSLSKSHSMQGYRVGVAVGNAEAIGALARLKAYVDSGIPTAIQEAAIAALNGPQESSDAYRLRYQRRRDLVVDTLQGMHIHTIPPGGGLYVWARVPPGFATSMDFARKVVEEVAVVVTPGSGFGAYGEGYFRIAFTLSDQRLAEAMHRLQQFHSEI
jgi:LL-diaminopimelate aminotransferase